MHTTSRLGLSVVDGTDNVSAFPAVHSENMTVLDAAVNYTTGTLAGRALLSPAPVAGQVYYATDAGPNGTFYLYSGSSWGSVPVPGAWTNLTLATGIVSSAGAGYYTPAVRLRGVDWVEISGSMQNQTGSTITAGSAAWATIPAGFRPTSKVIMPVVSINGSGVASGGGQIDTFGNLTLANAITNLGSLYLDGLAYRLS